MKTHEPMLLGHLAHSPSGGPRQSRLGGTLTQRLAEPRVLLALGVYDALSALIAEQAGFEALYLSGASIAYTRLGRSDIGLTTYTEVADSLARITERVRLPMIRSAALRRWASWDSASSSSRAAPRGRWRMACRPTTPACSRRAARWAGRTACWISMGSTP